MYRLMMGLVVALAIGAVGSAARATTMDINTLTGAGETCVENVTNPCYGDNVNSTSDTTGTYTAGNGFTPNVTTTYGSGMRTFTGTDRYLSPSFNGNQASFTLTAAPGFNVKLNSVALAVFGTQNENFDVWQGGIGGTLLTTMHLVNATTTTSFLLNLTAPDITIAWTTWNAGITAVNFDQVAVAATPIPAALPLFASALGGLGLLGWRRKRAGAQAA